MIVIHESAYKAVPWKNGGGTTREILREPVYGTEFDWRLSLANVDVPGPFSAFDGYHRTLVLVSGAGVELDFGEQGRARLDSVGQRVSFDGSWPTACTLLDGPSTDLNLIVLPKRVSASTDTMQLTQPQIIPTSNWADTLLCCIAGAVRLSNSAGQSEELHGVDVARCSPRDGAISCVPLGTTGAHLFVAGITRP
jgi:environmental stress-induced protein Ves